MNIYHKIILTWMKLSRLSFVQCEPGPSKPPVVFCDDVSTGSRRHYLSAGLWPDCFYGCCWDKITKASYYENKHVYGAFYVYKSHHLASHPSFSQKMRLLPTWRSPSCQSSRQWSRQSLTRNAQVGCNLREICMPCTVFLSQTMLFDDIRRACVSVYMV